MTEKEIIRLEEVMKSYGFSLYYVDKLIDEIGFFDKNGIVVKFNDCNYSTYEFIYKEGTLFVNSYLTSGKKAFENFTIFEMNLHKFIKDVIRLKEAANDRFDKLTSF